jgi:hypothetical protein
MRAKPDKRVDMWTIKRYDCFLHSSREPVGIVIGMGGARTVLQGWKSLPGNVDVGFSIIGVIAGTPPVPLLAIARVTFPDN